ncbi:hypothetical protein RGUI_3771 [Rhodovulum sp. P5]|nr:hypothetical protein RGUI_3771 [Rhodovulum sp. P5]
MLRLLLEAGADPRIGTPDGLTPLHAIAAYPGGREPDNQTAALAQMLVTAGGDIHAVSQPYGWTPLQRALMEGTAGEVGALLRAGADPNAPFGEQSQPWFTPGRLPLQVAGADPAKVRRLLDYGARPDLRDMQDGTVNGYLEDVLARHMAANLDDDRDIPALETSLALLRDWPKRS